MVDYNVTRESSHFLILIIVTMRMSTKQTALLYFKQSKHGLNQSPKA